MRRPSPIFLLALLLPLAASSVARADDDPATALARRGVDLRRADRNEEALAAFSEAYRLAPKPSMRAQMGLAEQALGRWIDAEHDLDGALASPDDPWIAKNREPLEQARDVVRQHLAWIAVDVDVPSAKLELDGAPLASGVEARAVAGTRALQASADGFVPDLRIVTVTPGEHVHVAIALRPLVVAPSAAPVIAPAPAIEPSPAPPPPVAISRASRVPAGPIALGAVGVVALAGGAYAGLRAMHDKSDEQAAIRRGDDLAASSAYSDGRTSSVVSTIAFGAGAAAIAGGALWWLFGSSASHDATQGLHATPLVGARAGGLTIRGTW